MGFAQSIADRSSITLGVGGETSLGTSFVRTGPAFNGDYELRLNRYFSVDMGQETWMPRGLSAAPESVLPGINLIGPPTGIVFVPIPTRRLSTASHTTGRAIVPFAHDRLELFMGAGGGYAWNLDRSPLPSGFVLEFEAGGRFALDNKKRFWFGASSQFFGNFSSNRQQWFATTANVGFRFGRH